MKRMRYRSCATTGKSKRGKEKAIIRADKDRHSFSNGANQIFTLFIYKIHLFHLICLVGGI